MRIFLVQKWQRCRENSLANDELKNLENQVELLHYGSCHITALLKTYENYFALAYLSFTRSILHVCRS